VSDIYVVVGFEVVAPYTLRIVFDDDSVQTIDFHGLWYRANSNHSLRRRLPETITDSFLFASAK